MCRDRNRARAPVGGGFPASPFRLRGGFPVPPWATFPGAPLRSRTVGFPESGSDLGCPPRAFPVTAGLKCWHTYTPIVHGLPTGSPLLRGSVHPSSVSGVRPGAAQCPEPLRPTRVLPSSGRCQAPPGGALPPLHRSYGLMRRTRSLPPPTVAALVSGSLQVAASPCWEVALPDVIPASPSLDAWTLTPAARRVLLPVSSPTISAFPEDTAGRRRRHPLSDFRAGIDFGATVIH